MKLLFCNPHPHFQLFSKRNCWQTPDAAKDAMDVSKVEIKSNYQNEEEAGKTVDDMADRAQARVKSLTPEKNGNTLAAATSGQINALQREAKMRLAQAELLKGSNIEKERKRIINEYQVKLLALIGTPGLVRERQVLFTDTNEKGTVPVTIKATAVEKVEKDGKSTEKLTGKVTGEKAENALDQGAQHLASAIAKIESSSVDWRGWNGLMEKGDTNSQDKQYIISEITAALGDNFGKGYLVTTGLNDPYIIGPLFQKLENWSHTRPKYPEINGFVAQIHEGRAKIEADTKNFIDKQDLKWGTAQTFLQNLGFGENDIQYPGVFGKTDVDVTLADSINYDKDVAGLEGNVRTLFDGEKGKVSTTLEGLTTTVTETKGKTQDKALIDQGNALSGTLTTYTAILATLNADGSSIETVAGLAKTLKVLIDAMPGVKAQVDAYKALVEPPKAGTEPAAAPGDVAANAGTGSAPPAETGTPVPGTVAAGDKASDHPSVAPTGTANVPAPTPVPTGGAEKAGEGDDIKVTKVAIVDKKVGTTSIAGIKNPPVDQYDDIKPLPKDQEAKVAAKLEKITKDQIKADEKPHWYDFQTNKGTILVCVSYDNEDHAIDKHNPIITYRTAKPKNAPAAAPVEPAAPAPTPAPKTLDVK